MNKLRGDEGESKTWMSFVNPVSTERKAKMHLSTKHPKQREETDAWKHNRWRQTYIKITQPIITIEASSPENVEPQTASLRV
jgi:hypothetical protein